MADKATNQGNRRRGGQNVVIFPEKLHSILDRIEADGKASVVSWLPHGKSFKIHNEAEFSTTILPKYFWLLKASFQRQLNIYGFKRVKTGPDRGAIYHELFIRDKRGLCRGMTRRINVKEKRLAEERAKHEKLYKQQEGGDGDIRADKTDIDRPPRRAPFSKLQTSGGVPPDGANGAYLGRGQKPPPPLPPAAVRSDSLPVRQPPAAVNPDSLPVRQQRAIAPGERPVYAGPPPPRFPRGPSYLRAALPPPHMEAIGGDAVPSELIHRDLDLRRRVYVGEPIHGRGEFIDDGDAPLLGYPPDYVADPRERRAMLAHAEGHPMYPLPPHPRAQRLASLQRHYYELDHDLLQDELVYHSRRPMPVSAHPYPPVMEMPPPGPEELVRLRASDPRIARHVMAGRIAAGSDVYPGEATALRAAETRGAPGPSSGPPTGPPPGPPTFLAERRRVDDAMLLLRLNENSH